MNVAKLEAEYRAAKAVEDAEYWRFTRCANVNPSRLADLTAETNRRRRAWLDARYESARKFLQRRDADAKA